MTETWVPNVENFSNLSYTGSSAMNISEEILLIDKRIVSVELELSSLGNTNELFIISFESNRTSPSIVIPWYTRNLYGVSSLLYTPDISLVAEVGDNLLITWDNSTGLDYSLTLNYVPRFTVWRMDGLWR